MVSTLSIPFSISANIIKFSIAIEDTLAAFTSVVVMAYLSAPGAEKFGAPKALSFKLESVVDCTNDSVTCNPTTPFGVWLYLSPPLSNVIEPAGTNTKLPLKKNTPSLILKDEFLPTAFVIDEPEPAPTFTNGVPEASL